MSAHASRARKRLQQLQQMSEFKCLWGGRFAIAAQQVQHLQQGGGVLQGVQQATDPEAVDFAEVLQVLQVLHCCPRTREGASPQSLRLRSR